jgi:dibenzofuran dioxygenase alpha subunit
VRDVEHCDLAALVDLDQGRISPRLFVDPEIYHLELEKIFARCWIFLAHESQIRESGEYVTTWIGEDPIIVCRDRIGKIRAYLNMCRHRGALVCHADAGRTGAFTCRYHGWSYSTEGQLVGVPFEEKVYPNGELRKEEIRLVEVPRVESYGGFIFGCWDEHAESLEAYLGDFRWYFDIFLERALGEWEVVAGVQRCVIECNWKLHAENFGGDSYHVLLTHAFATRPGLNPFFSLGSLPLYMEFPAHVVTFEQGHSMIDVLYHGEYYQADLEAARRLGPEAVEYVEACYQKVRTRKSPEQADVYGLGPGLIFPNLMFLDFGCLFPAGFYFMRPRGPERHEYWAIHLQDSRAPQVVKEILRRDFIMGQAAGGTFTPDDTDNFWGMTQALRGIVGQRQWLDYRSGLAREGAVQIEGRPGNIGPRPSDRGQRNFYRRWLELMTA